MSDPASTKAGPSFRAAVKPCAPATLCIDATGKITAANKSALALWQAAETELVGEAFAGLFAFEIVSQEPDWLTAQWEVLVAAAIDTWIPLKALPREGAPVDVRVRLEAAIPDNHSYFATIDLPASAVASGGSAPDERAASLQFLTEKGSAGFFDLNFKDGRAYYSPVWKKILGYVDAELPNSYESWLGLIHPDDSSAAPDKVGRKQSPGPHPFSLEFRMKHRKGHYIWIQSIGVQVVGEDGKLERAIGTHIDITDRKELEESSIANDERLQSLGDGGPLGLFDLDFLQKRFWFSPAWKRLLGYAEHELPDAVETFSAVLAPEEKEAGPAAYFLGRATGQAIFSEAVRIRHKDGRLLPALLGVHRTLTRKRELARIVGFHCPLPEGFAATAADALSIGEIGIAALEAVAEGVLITNSKGSVVYANAPACRMLGMAPDKANGQAVADLFQLVNRESGKPGDDPVDRALSADDPLPLISEHSLAGGPGRAARPIVWTARVATDAERRPQGIVIIFRDPDEMTLTPDELVKANRFESLGLLAGGIAHDFNNLLTTILGGVSLAKDNRDESALGDAEKACLTAKGLTKQLLAFAKGGSGTQSIVAPKEIISDSIKIAAAGATCTVTVDCPEGLEPVQVDRAQILQVFQNLIVNAVQAMPPAPHAGAILLRVDNVSVKEGQMPSLAAGNYVGFEVRDNGSGIKPEHLEKIWDPFFTTKKHGTGLGLATVLSIVRKHGGQIGVESVLGTGTTFTIFLPAADKPVEVQARRAATLRFGTGRVLFMDDDPKITALTSSMLQSLDYKFDTAKNGDEAIALYKRYLNIGRPYDAVIMDLTVIGGMGGEECFKELKKLDPEVRAIVSSGYDNDDMARQYLDMGFCGYLTKPYRVTDLGKVIKAVAG